MQIMVIHREIHLNLLSQDHQDHLVYALILHILICLVKILYLVMDSNSLARWIIRVIVRFSIINKISDLFYVFIFILSILLYLK